MAKKLVVSDGIRERELQLVGTIVVGRDPLCDITYDDALLSRRHAEFVAAGDRVTVRDLGSRNGVFVNGAKIAEHLLRSGDIVQIGPVRARYLADNVPVSIAPGEVDVDHTAVLHHAGSGTPGPTPSPGAALASAPPRPAPPPASEDDDRTRMIPAPRSVAAAASVAQAAPLSTPRTPASEPVGDDDEKTQFLRAPHAAAAPAAEAAAAPPPLASPALEVLVGDDEEKTQFLRTPRPTALPAAPAADARDPAADAPTETAPLPIPTVAADAAPMEKPSPAALAVDDEVTVFRPAAARPPVAVAAPPASVRAAQGSLSTFVFVQVLALAAVVLVATAIPLTIWRPAQGGVNSADAPAPFLSLAFPVVVAVAAAYCVGALINRRFVHALASVERDRT